MLHIGDKMTVTVNGQRLAAIVSSVNSTWHDRLYKLALRDGRLVNEGRWFAEDELEDGWEHVDADEMNEAERDPI